MKVLLSIMLCAISLPVFANSIYRGIDKSGIVTFSDAPMHGVSDEHQVNPRGDLSVIPEQGSAATPTASQQVDASLPQLHIPLHKSLAAQATVAKEILQEQSYEVQRQKRLKTLKVDLTNTQQKLARANSLFQLASDNYSKHPSINAKDNVYRKKFLRLLAARIKKTRLHLKAIRHVMSAYGVKPKLVDSGASKLPLSSDEIDKLQQYFN